MNFKHDYDENTVIDRNRVSSYILIIDFMFSAIFFCSNDHVWSSNRFASNKQ